MRESIRKITGIVPTDIAAVEAAFAEVEPRPIAACNWAGEYPYAPGVAFRLFHTGEWLMLRFEVEERYTAARVTQENGEVWTDSCVEFFLQLEGDASYYNFETTCIGRMLLGYRRSREQAELAPLEVIDSIRRNTSLPFGEPFAEREGENRWSLTLAIPPTALFRHALTTWEGLDARINLYKCGDKLTRPHFLSWRPIATPSPDFHRPEFFAPVHFE